MYLLIKEIENVSLETDADICVCVCVSMNFMSRGDRMDTLKLKTKPAISRPDHFQQSDVEQSWRTSLQKAR